MAITGAKQAKARQTNGVKGKTTRAKKSKKEEASDDEAQVSDAPSEAEEEEEEEQPGRSSKKGWIPPDESDLPPITTIPEMFDDLVKNAKDIAQVAKHVQGRKLRVATMCSGTESPLLALGLIFDYIEKHYGTKLEFDHVFSCEIEPFKQAYIERNFSPPLLFRDVCELGDDMAHTAYGSLEPVPGDVDILIAGTSCVDYSNLNNEKQGIDANGESGRTFRGMMGWVKRHRPPIVILENVLGAPWDRVVDYFDESDYDATHIKMDTKNSYIPHTRQRKYLMAAARVEGIKTKNYPKQWVDVTKELQRDASASLDAFLLPSDDPRIQQARQKLVEESFNSADRKTGRTDWARCESRHQRARLEEMLGSKRPLTSWEEGGSCKILDFAWSDWAVGQVERVWDLLDISLLRSAKKGIDPSYKTDVWNLSQNVDRSHGSGKTGICPCLTPSMIPYITNRGGPMVGLEALSMQGLPIDQLLLTRESEDQLADLAGNAMSTTVVGTCIIASLIVAQKLLKKGNDSRTYEEINQDPSADVQEDAVMKDASEQPAVAESLTIVGTETLTEQPLPLGVAEPKPLPELLSEALKSTRLCLCEGRTDVTEVKVMRCADCGTSACVKCGGRPEHNNEHIDLTVEPREHPSKFFDMLKSSLAMSLRISGITEEGVEQLKNDSGVSIPASQWEPWKTALLEATQNDLRFTEIRRQEVWSVVYNSPTAVLILHLHPLQPEWQLFGKAKTTEPAKAEIRRLLLVPVARCRSTDDLLTGKWDIGLPHSTTFDIDIEGVGELVPSWGARLGLVGPEFIDNQVFSQVKVTVSADAPTLDRGISGTYQLLPRCGTANGALHKRMQEEAGNLPPLFLFLDPHRTNTALDTFVFSTTIKRCEFQEFRPTVCRLDSSWRQSDSPKQTVQCSVPCHWVPWEVVHFETASGEGAVFSTPKSQLQVAFSADSCQSPTAILCCKVPLSEDAGPEWPRQHWLEVDKVHERAVFKSLAWILESTKKSMDSSLSVWNDVDGETQVDCERCSPKAPEVKWMIQGKRHVPKENHTQAGAYERGLKSRPSPFVTRLQLDENQIGHVQIAINFSTVIHRAFSRLPSIGRTAPVSLSYRLDSDFIPMTSMRFPKLSILSNKEDEEHTQPPSFKLDLRPEQLRSLKWMIAQESSDAEPFVEEEVSEAILGPLGWRIEGRARRTHLMRGGVLADAVGYGKTAITLGLLDCNYKSAKAELAAQKKKLPGKIRVNGTLVIVPSHLTGQWASEVNKFLGKKYKVLVIPDMKKLKSTSIDDVREADLIIVGSDLFKRPTYAENLAAFAGCRKMPTAEGRHFTESLEKVLEGVKRHTDLLRSNKGGGAAVSEAIKEAHVKHEAEDAEMAELAQSKRLKGKKYRDAQQSKEGEESDASVGTQEDSPRNWQAKAKSGMVPEVIISSKPSSSSSEKSGKKTPATTDASDGEVSKARPKRAASKKVIVISDDEDDEPVAPIKPKPRAKRGAKSKPKPKRKASKASETSDYEDTAGDSGDETPPDSDFVDADDFSDDDEPVAKKTAKGKGKGRASAISVSSNDEMEVDEDEDEDEDDEAPASKGKTGAKRKAGAHSAGPAKKKAKVTKKVDTWKEFVKGDQWKLNTKAVKDDYDNMQCPPLEMFDFNRIVVDEYTYLTGNTHALITAQSGVRHWMLSGTPPIHDFGAVKTIATFIQVHLGIDDDAEGRPSEVRKRRKDQSAAEKFHAFREVRSVNWHARRHELGQRFLNHFVRQNIAEIDEIPFEIKLKRVTLPAAERAIYLELEHHLRALDMTIKRAKKSESDREKRLNQSLGDSKTAEEALLKRCSHFDLDANENENAVKACDVIVQERQRQLDECKASLLKALKAAATREKEIRRKIPQADQSIFNEYVNVMQTKGLGDKEATQTIRDLLEEAGASAQKGSKTKDAEFTEKQKAEIWEHREKTHEIRRISKELVGRVRSLRYFTVVRDLQKQRAVSPVISCPACKRTDVPLEEAALLSSCGHAGCLSCVRECADKEECVYGGAVGECDSAARSINIIKADTLGVDETRMGKGKRFGEKIERILHLIKETIPKDERILIFVQFPDLMKRVADALTHHKITFLEIKGTSTQKSNSLTAFQNPDSPKRVLLLNVMDESASGANLTVANHAIFLSPLLAPSQEMYDACETQAVGRLVRFGQGREVRIWRFMSTGTIDEEIFEGRDKGMLEKMDDEE